MFQAILQIDNMNSSMKITVGILPDYTNNFSTIIYKLGLYQLLKCSKNKLCKFINCNFMISLATQNAKYWEPAY